MCTDEAPVEPLSRQIANLIERSGLLEQMARAGNDLEPPCGYPIGCGCKTQRKHLNVKSEMAGTRLRVHRSPSGPPLNARQSVEG
jgi:hypothetical protein